MPVTNPLKSKLHLKTQLLPRTEQMPYCCWL